LKVVSYMLTHIAIFMSIFLRLRSAVRVLRHSVNC
jgi:hypothetical protein